MMNVFLLILFFLLDGAALQRTPKPLLLPYHRCKLPDGITNFQKMRERNFCYVDKTGFVSKMFKTEQVFYFIARPRKFGKSLFCRTLEAVFWGKEQLFQGLSIHATHDWKVYPVIYLDFSGFGMQCKDATVYAEKLVWEMKKISDEIIRTHQDQMQNHKVRINADVPSKDAFDGKNETDVQCSLENLVDSLNQAFSSEVAIVIDEYDNFISHNLNNPMLVTSVSKEVLQPFYSKIKNLENKLRFVFITGVARFTQSYLFSSMNNLNDISQNEEYAEMLGFTVKEMQYFAPEIQNVVKYRREEWNDEVTTSQEMKEITDHYDGYKFTAGGSAVFHPSFLMSYLNTKDHEVPAGKIPAPQFLFKILPRHQYSAKLLRGMNVTAQDLRGVTDPNNLKLAPLLFHSGIFSIKKYDRRTNTYFLHYPNQHVKEYFENPTFEKLMEPLGGLGLNYESFADRCIDMTKFLMDGDEESVKLYFKKLDVLAIRRGYGTYPRKLKNQLDEDYQFTAEGAFQYMMEICLDCSKEGRITLEKQFAHGRGDIEFMAIKQSKTILFETKAGEKDVEKGLNQLLSLYARAYLNEKRTIVCVAVSFSLETRLLEDWIYVEYDEWGNRQKFFSMKERDVEKMNLYDISMSDPNSSNIH